MLKLKLPYFGHLMRRADSLEKTLMLGKIEGRRKRGWQRMRWLEGIMHTHLCTHPPTPMHTCAHTHTHVRAAVHTPTPMHMCAHTHTHVRAAVHTPPPHPCTRVHTPIHMCAQPCTHAQHIPARVCGKAGSTRLPCARRPRSLLCVSLGHKRPFSAAPLRRHFRGLALLVHGQDRFCCGKRVRLHPCRRTWESVGVRG